MSEQIKACPYCRSDLVRVLYQAQNWVSVYCANKNCASVARENESDAILAWNQMALAFEIARADAIMECSGEVHIYDELSFANETAAHNAACDAHTRYRRAMDEWRHTNG